MADAHVEAESDDGEEADAPGGEGVIDEGDGIGGRVEGLKDGGHSDGGQSQDKPGDKDNQKGHSQPVSLEAEDEVAEGGGCGRRRLRR